MEKNRYVFDLLSIVYEYTRQPIEGNETLKIKAGERKIRMDNFQHLDDITYYNKILNLFQINDYSTRFSWKRFLARLGKTVKNAPNRESISIREDVVLRVRPLCPIFRLLFTAEDVFEKNISRHTYSWVR